MTGPVLAVDLGGTNMRAAIVDPDGTITLRVSEPTPHDAPCPEALRGLMTTVRDRGGGPGSFEAVVVGVPGRVNYSAGRLEHAPNLPASWAGDLTEAELARHFVAEGFLANDADLAAVGEAHFGAGRALDRYADAAGIDAHGAELVTMVRNDHVGANEAWDRTVCAAGTAVLNLTHLFSPDAVVVGGGVGRNGPLVLDPITAMVERHGPTGLQTPIAIVGATLGDDPGLVGAAAWPRAIRRR